MRPRPTFRGLLLSHASEFAMERAGIPMARYPNTPPGPPDGAAGPSNTEKPSAAGQGLGMTAQDGKAGTSATTTKGA